jgi:hypothetical protein
MSGFSFTVDRSAEILVDARIRINVAEPVAAGLVVTLTATAGGITSTHTGATAMSYTLPADKMVKLGIAYTDAKGNPAQVDGAIRWESSNPEIATCEPTPPIHGPEGSLVMIVPGEEIGNCQITAKADADLGDGTRELVTMVDITVVGGEAVAGVITPAGEPVPIA